MTTTTNPNLQAAPTPVVAPVTYVVDTATALTAVERLRSATWVAADTETVARRADGTLRDLNVDGPGALRVLSLAGRFDTADGVVVESYVFDFGDHVVVAPETASAYGVSSTSAFIDRPAFAEAIKDCTWYFWNADFDERVLQEAGISPRFYEDLMLYQASLALGSSGVSFYDSLAQVANWYLGVDIDGKGTVQLSYTADLPLDIDQVRYAADDVIATCELVKVLSDKVEAAQLTDTVNLEVGARPFRSLMERSGIPFDVTGWRTVLAKVESEVERIEARLAELTGGGQASLFDAIERPTWNPSSPEDVKKVLNTYAADAVKKHLGGRLFEKFDSIDNAALQMLDCDIARSLLEHREQAKLLSTYGEKFITNVRSDGRVHARYLQNVVSTGRLSSSKPNMQNNAPQMKPFYTPVNRPTKADDGTWNIAAGQRVFVLGDLGQAELRYAAQVSGDPALIEAFIRGDDMHVVTASRMFHVDMVALKETDPKEYKTYRQRGKTMNFAVIYGLGPRALGQTLTLAGIPTTPDEAGELLRLYLEAFPEVAKWLAGRDATIKAMTTQPPRCDFDRTLRLHRLLPKVNAAKNALKAELNRAPSLDEIVDRVTPKSDLEAEMQKRLGHQPTPDELDTEWNRRIAVADWALRFRAPVVVAENGEPLAFESRTTVGRRRIFNVSAEAWISSILLSVATARRGEYVAIRQAFEAQTDVALSKPDGKTLTREQLKKKFEDKEFKLSFLSFILRSLGGRADQLCYAAVADCIGGLGNAYRNAPIQGGVADAVLMAYQMLYERLARFTNAVPVQSVHDSIVLEVNVEEAEEIAQILKDTMEEGLKHFCPDVPAKADVDIATSLDSDKDGIDAVELRAAFAQ